MNQPVTFRHEFVQFVPEELQEGTIYVSIRFATVAHLCACGCKIKVVTPLKPTDWKLTFDGKTITLYPSIGNWSFPCRSHYWIRNNKVKWAGNMSQKKIDENRAYDRYAKEKYFGGVEEDSDAIPSAKPEASQPKPMAPWWKKLWPW